MQVVAKASGKVLETTPLAMYGMFIDRIKESLHFALAFPPIGDSFKKRIRIYPSLVNCCTIDWYTSWPEDALQKVAEYFVRSMELPGSDDSFSISSMSTATIEDDSKVKERKLTLLEKKLVEMVMTFNTSVAEASEKFYNEQGRKNYVTPTSYLEMLRSFKILYKKTFVDITMQRDRYMTGLEKLEFAAGQVAVMQKKLQDLQPQLKVTSDETEKIMVKIERDTAEAEKKKEVFGADEAAANDAAATSQAIRDDYEGDLAEAVPALESAFSALDTLKPADITVVKSMKNPPAAIKLVLEAVCVLRGLKPDRKPDAMARLVNDEATIERLALKLENKEVGKSANVCNECGLKFVIAKQYTKPRIHMECHEMFKLLAPMSPHHKCEPCRMVFNSDSAFGDHVMIHNSSENVQLVPAEGLSQIGATFYKVPTGDGDEAVDEAVWNCTHCPVRYFDENDCVTHVMLLHSMSIFCNDVHLQR